MSRAEEWGDPCRRALLYVQQYLQEQGYHEALSVLERECGLLYDDDKYEQAGMLMELTYQKLEAEAAASFDEGAAARAAEEHALLHSGHDDCADTLVGSVERLHRANIICVRWWPGRGLLATGSGDGSVALFSWTGDLKWRTFVGSGGGVLSLEMHPSMAVAAASAAAAAAEQGAAQAAADASSSSRDDAPEPSSSSGPSPATAATNQILVGCMDGSLAILDAETGAMLTTAKPHTKYLVHAQWSPDGCHIATASYDQTMALLRVTRGDGGASSSAVELVRQVTYPSNVQDVAFICGGSVCLVAVRGSCYLHRIDVASAKDLPPSNMNATGDEHVSFSAMRLAPSRCGRYCLVATDSLRLLLLRSADCSQLRMIYGLPHDNFHVPSLAWHHDLSYVYVGTAGAAIHVYATSIGKEVAVLSKHHANNVRDIDYDPVQRLLASCSFDKTVKVYRSSRSPS